MIGLIKGTARQAKTVSGLPLPIASYKSNSKLPIQELSLSINPTQSGSGDPAPDNIRPITGVSSVNVMRTGKNLFDESEFQNLRTNYEYVDSSYYCRSIQLLPNTTYTVSQNAGSTSNVLILINATSHVNDIGYFDLRKASDVKTFTTDNSGKLYIGVHIYTSDTQYNERLEQCKVQIELGSTASDYSAYQGNTYTIALGDTYYGATLDVVRGKLVCNTGFISWNGSDNWSSDTQSGNPVMKIARPSGIKISDMMICSHAVRTSNSSQIYSGYYFVGNSNILFGYSGTLAEWQTLLNSDNLQIRYELATPIEIDLTPEQINSLLGSNNIWHDGNGDVEVLKFMDRQLYFGR